MTMFNLSEWPQTRPMIFAPARTAFWAMHARAASLYHAWRAAQHRKANLRFVMKLDPIVLRDLGFTRDEIAARHDGPLPISRWRNNKPLD